MMDRLKEDILITKILLMSCTEYVNKVHIPWRPSHYKVFNKIVSPYKQLCQDLSKLLFFSLRKIFPGKISKRFKIEELIKEATVTTKYSREVLKRAGEVLRASLEKVEKVS